MKRSKFDEKRDQRIADEFTEDKSLMCHATGCPCRWTADMGNGKLCHWHDNADKHDWPRVTQEIIDEISRLALKKAVDNSQPAPAADVARFKAEMRKLATAWGANISDPKLWAKKLRDREMAGERLSFVQRQAWRDTLKQSGDL
jgi:hypothetical protein